MGNCPVGLNLHRGAGHKRIHDRKVRVGRKVVNVKQLDNGVYTNRKAISVRPLGESALKDDNGPQTIPIPFTLTILPQCAHSNDQSIVTGIISLGGINPAMSTNHYTDLVPCLHPIWKGPSLTPGRDTRIYNRQQSPAFVAFGQSCWSGRGREL
ncbi:hypothetical protein AVEN_239545-1 [Araneus ventricosus]|uniref:Uncharacterized protein n=1 Tax=Araneus ventricosus TaxID=182803 RepID=A0A4Y2HLS6_ARAVE|nr:hypothetical protein AVEN_239545-1 [Araneus ventricosus]